MCAREEWALEGENISVINKKKREYNLEKRNENRRQDKIQKGWSEREREHKRETD